MKTNDFIIRKCLTCILVLALFLMSGGYAWESKAYADAAIESAVNGEEADGSTTIMPMADTFLNGGSNVNQNYGADPTLQVRTWAGDANYTRESYMQFDLSGYVGDIGSAKLNLYAAIINPNGSPYNFQLYGTEDDTWDEELVTWTYKPSLDHYLANVNVGLTWRWIQVDVTSFVKAQLASDKVASFGMSQNAKSGALIHINSKENGANQPYLTISGMRNDASSPLWADGSSVQVTQMNATGIQISWSEAEDSNEVTGYRVYRNGILMATVEGTSWHTSISEADMDKTFTYKIEAGNSSNHWTNDGPYVSATIPTTKLVQTKIGNVFMDNEPIRFQVATLRPDITWSVNDMRGANISQGSAVNENGNVLIDVPFSGHGYFTFEASVKGEGLEPIKLKTSFAVLSPFDVSGIEESPFGIATHLHRGQKKVVPLIQYAGAKTIRDGIEWRVLERTKGEYDFSPVPDDYMAELEKHGLNMLFVSGFNNPYYDNNATPYTDAGREGFANYVEAYVQQYKDQMVAAEAYNEFNGGFGKRGNSPANSQPEYYYKLLKKTYETVKAKHPDFPVIGIVASEDAMDWIEEVFRLGGLQYMDAVSVHPYRYPDAPEGLADSMEELKALIRQYNDGQLKPIWATEFGYPTFQSTRGVDELTQANYMVRYYVIALASGIEKTFWYDLVNDGVRVDYNEDNFGMLRNAADPMGAFTPKPAYAAYAAMTRELTGAEFVREETIGGDIKSYVFDQSGQQVRAVWSLSPVSAAILTEDPIQITDMMGNSNTYTPYQGRVYVSLNGEPIYVKGNIQGMEENAMFTVIGEETVAGEQALFNVRMNNTASQSADFILNVEESSYAIFAGGGQNTEFTVTVEGLKEPGTRLLTGTVMSGTDQIGLLRHAVAVGPSEEIRIRPILTGSDSESKTLQLKVTNLSKRNELRVDDVRWQLGANSGQMTIDQSVSPNSTSGFEIPLENIPNGQSYTLNVTVNYGDNKTFVYSGKVEFNPIYAATVQLDGYPDSSVTANTASINLSEGTVRVSGYGGSGDLSGEVWLNFDRDHFYLTAEIKDDTFAHPASGKDIWNNDSIQFAISNGLPAEDVNYYEYGISQTPDGPQIYRWLTPSGVANGLVTNGELQVSRDEDQQKTRYELALPWSELLPIQTDEGVISFSLLVNENDGGLRRGWIEWGSGIGEGKAPGKFRTMQWLRGTSPEIFIDGVQDGERYRDAATPIIQVEDADDDLRDVEILLDGNAWTSGTSVLAKGEHTLVVTAADNAGNKVMETIRFSVFHSTVLETQTAAGEYSDVVWMHAVLKDQSGATLGGELVDFHVGGIYKGTGQTNEHGEARFEYQIDQGVLDGSDIQNVLFKAMYNGSEEGYYEDAEADGALAVSKEQASVIFTGSASAEVNGMLTLQATVIQDLDGSYGSLQQLPIQFILSRMNPDGTLSPVESSVSGNVYETDAEGSVSVSIQLPTGLYEVKTELLDNPYYKNAVQVSTVAIYDASAGMLQMNGFIDIEESGSIIGDKAKKIQMNVKAGHGEKKDSIRIHATPQGMDIELTETDWIIIADGGSAYVQGRFDRNGEQHTLRLTLQLRDGETPIIAMQIWKGLDTTVFPVFQTIEKPLSGNASVHP